MSRIPKGKNDKYVHGTSNAICDVCGFKYKLSDLRKRWDGMLVCNEDWESRHPLDYPPSIRPNSVPEDTRPDNPNPEFVDIRPEDL